MATAQAVAKGTVVSPCGNRAAGFGGRRRGASVAARVSPCAPAAVRIGRKSPFLGARLAVGPRRSKLVPRNLVASPVQVNLLSLFIQVLLPSIFSIDFMRSCLFNDIFPPLTDVSR